MGIIECDLPINAGPHTYVLRASLRALDAWIRTGEAPPSQPKLQNNADLTGYEVDENGIALGGIRTPYVDVPLAVLSGLGQSGGFCGLFGTTGSYTLEKLAEMYGTRDAFIEKWNASVDEALAAGVILEEDVDHIKAAAEGFPEI
jgi:hypothetical protein